METKTLPSPGKTMKETAEDTDKNNKAFIEKLVIGACVGAALLLVSHYIIPDKKKKDPPVRTW